MKKSILVLVFLASFCLLSSAYNYKRDGADNVISLDSDSFDHFIASSKPVLVAFVSPTCGWCHRLAPEYAAAAEYLELRDVFIARLDAAANGDIRERLGVASFPTILKFKNGEMLEQYSGGRSKNEFIEYMIGYSPKNPKISSEEELLELRTSIDTNYLVYYGPGSGNFWNRLDKLQKSGEMSSVQVVEWEAPEEKAVLYMRYSAATLQGLTEGIELTAGQLVASTIKILAAPRIVEFKNPNWFSDSQIHSPIPVLRVFLSVPTDFEVKKALYAALLPVSEKYKGKFIFAFNDRELYNEDLTYYSLTERPTSFGLFDFGKGKVYLGEGEYTPQKVESLIESYLKQEAKHLIRKSEPLPTGQEGKLIKKIVASNFHDTIWKYGTDAFILMRTENIEHSNRLARVYEQAVKELTAEKTFEGLEVSFFEFDSTLNELPISYHVTLSSFGGEPTIFAAPSSAKIGPLFYEESDYSEDLAPGEYLLESVKEFLKESSYNLEDKQKSASKKANVKPKEPTGLKDEL